MVRYGGFISDNEDGGAEASAIKDTGINVKKPAKGFFASISILRSFCVTHTLQTPVAVYSNSKQPHKNYERSPRWG